MCVYMYYGNYTFGCTSNIQNIEHCISISLSLSLSLSVSFPVSFPVSLDRHLREISSETYPHEFAINVSF